MLDSINERFFNFIASVREKSLPVVPFKDEEKERTNQMKVYIEDNKNFGKVIKATKEQKDGEDDKKRFKLRRNERCIAMSDLFKYCFGQDGIFYGICKDDCEYDHEYEYEYLYDYDYDDEYEYEEDQEE